MPLSADLQPRRFRCFEYRKHLEGGLTKPRLVVGTDDDGRTVDLILKLREPGTERGHHGGTSLAAELACAILARAVGLRVPTYGVADVDASFAEGVGDGEARAALLRNIGRNFATVFLPRRIPWDPTCTKLSLDLRDSIDDVMSFDATVINGDRKATKPNLLWDGDETVHVIDHGMACPVYKWSSEQIDASPLLPAGEVRAHCGYQYLHGKRCRFREVHRRWDAVIAGAFWEDLKAVIPSEWEQRPGEIDSMMGFLKTRKAKFQEIGLDLRGVVQ